MNQPRLVNNHSESDLRVDPTNSNHLIEQTKWFVSAEGYNHLQGFYESFDGGKTWSAQGHIPGYEGFTDNTDPVGAFDAFGNYHALLLPYQFSYDKFGFQVFNNGSSLPNSALPGEAISSAVRPHGAISATDWNFTHNGSLDYLMTAPNAHSNDPDKQWITVDLNPSSPHYNRIYAMWTLFAFNPSSVFVSFSDANADGSHTDWSTPTVLPTINGHPWDNYMLPHVTPDGTVYTQPGLAKLILWIRSMTSRDTEGRPSGWRLFHFQYSRNPFRCQAMTVSGLTMTNADRQPLHSRESHTHRNRSAQLRRSRWLPEIEAREIIVRGEVIGTLKASERVQVWSTGSVTGDMETRGIVIEEGAVLRGKVDVRLNDQPLQSAARSAGT